MTNGGIFVGPGGGRTIPGTDALRLIATGEQTGGSVGVLEDTSSPGDGPPRHVHRSNDELFYVLEGEFLFLVGEWQESVPAETCVFVPRGTVHAYTRLQGHRVRARKVAFGCHPRGLGAGLRGVRQVAYRGRRGGSERAPKQVRGTEEQDVRGDKREVRLRVRGTTSLEALYLLNFREPPTAEVRGPRVVCFSLRRRPGRPALWRAGRGPSARGRARTPG